MFFNKSTFKQTRVDIFYCENMMSFLNHVTVATPGDPVYMLEKLENQQF